MMNSCKIPRAKSVFSKTKVIKLILLILFFLCSFFSLYADGQKSITIKHIGAQDVPWIVLIINTQKQGYLLEYPLNFTEYYAVSESVFDEIIDLINSESELFGEREWIQKYNSFRIYGSGSFELFIENGEEKYYCYLIEREFSLLFFNKLYTLIRVKGNNNDLMAILEDTLKQFF